MTTATEYTNPVTINNKDLKLTETEIFNQFPIGSRVHLSNNIRTIGTVTRHTEKSIFAQFPAADGSIITRRFNVWNLKEVGGQKNILGNPACLDVHTVENDLYFELGDIQGEKYAVNKKLEDLSKRLSQGFRTVAESRSAWEVMQQEVPALLDELEVLEVRADAKRAEIAALSK